MVNIKGAVNIGILMVPDTKLDFGLFWVATATTTMMIPIMKMAKTVTAETSIASFDTIAKLTDWRVSTCLDHLLKFR